MKILQKTVTSSTTDTNAFELTGTGYFGVQFDGTFSGATLTMKVYTGSDVTTAVAYTPDGTAFAPTTVGTYTFLGLGGQKFYFTQSGGDGSTDIDIYFGGDYTKKSPA